MSGMPGPVEDYFARLNAEQRRALQKIRDSIRAAAPDAEECVSYSLPAFRRHGRVLAIYGAWTRHCSLYPGPEAIAAHRDELRRYKISKGAINIALSQSMTSTLVRKLIRTSAASIESKSKSKPARRPAAATSVKKDRTDPAVSALLRTIQHPLKKEAERARKLLLGLSPSIQEGVKWNSMSFRTTDYFATWNWRCRDGVQFVFHRGAKVKDNSTAAVRIADPNGLIQWLATDRCLVTVGGRTDFAKNSKAFGNIVKAWIKSM